VNAASFSPDGKRVVTASSDQTARVWDAESGKEIAVLKAHEGAALGVGWHPSGERIVTAGADGLAKIWDVAWARVYGAELRGRVCDGRLDLTSQELSDAKEELGDPILSDVAAAVRSGDPYAANPCLRRGPLSWDYWARLPAQAWRAARWW
jgi:hypothetical protein